MLEYYHLNLNPAIRINLIAGLFIIPFLCLGQDSTGLEYLTIAKNEFDQENYTEANLIYKKAKEHYASTGEWYLWYKAYSGIAKIAYKTNDKFTIVDSLKKYYSSLPDTSYKIKRVSSANRAYYLFELGLMSDALLEYKNALKIVDERFPSDTIKMLSYLRSISNCYSALADQTSSLKFLEKGISLAEKSNNKKELCRLMSAKATSMFHDDRNREAIEVFEKLQNQCDENMLNYCCIAECYLGLKDIKNAKKNLNKADSLINTRKFESKEYNMFLYYKSEYLEEVKEFEEAITIKKQLLEELTPDYNIRRYIKEMVRLAQVEEKIGRSEDMVVNAHRALAWHFDGLDSINIYDRPKEIKDLPDIWIIEALYLKAKYFRSKYEKDNSDIRSNEESIFYHQLIFKLFDQLKSRYDSNASMYRIGDHTRSYYEGIVDYYCMQYLSDNSEDDYERGFALSQQANAYVLKNAISEREALDIAGTSQDSIDRYAKLKQLAINGQSADDILEFERYKKNVAKELNYFNHEKQNVVVSTQEIQGILKDDELLLKYFYVNKDLYLFKISKHAKEISRIQLPLEFDSLINRHKFLISNSSRWDESEYKTLSFEIYNTILASSLSSGPVNDKIKHLIIIPDGPLKKISFSSVIKNDVVSFIQPEDYLINDFEISYLYYAAQIRNSRNKSNKHKDELISFGIEYEDVFLKEVLSQYKNNLGEQDKTRRLSLSKLIFADDEAKNIAKIFDGDHLTNSEVTKPNVLEMIKKYNMLHFSAHAFVDLDNYLDSYLVLNKSNSEQYKLSYKDILNMGLDSDFVALSACQTASGLDISGEGLMSLSRAFIQSGCASTLSSFWNASDKATMDIMGLFYSQLADGESKSASLRKAQLEYLSNDNISVPSSRSPFYWSSWAINGNNSKIEAGWLTTFKSTKLILFAIGVFVALIFGYRFYLSGIRQSS